LASGNLIRDSEEMSRLQLTTVNADALSPGTRENITELCTRAYETDFRVLMETFHGATHILGFASERLVTHALWVPRWLQAGDGPLLHTAYVEAVATHPDFRRRGFAGTVMQRVVDEIQDFELGGLSPFSAEYYARLGWELWRGHLFIRTKHGLEPSPEDERVMILRLAKTPELDLTAPLSAEWREAELW